MQVEEQATEVVLSDASTALDNGLEGDPSRRITITATKRGCIVVAEGARPLGEKIIEMRCACLLHKFED